MENQGRGGTLTLRSGHTHYMLVKVFQEEIRLRGNLFILNVIVESIETDARTFEDKVVMVEVAIILLPLDELDMLVLGKLIHFEIFIAIRNHKVHFREMSPDETVS